MKRLNTFLLTFAAVSILAAGLQAAAITDDAGQKLNFAKPPARVVSLLPSATEIICALEAGEALAGVTRHDRYQPCLAGLPLVGGAFSPNFEVINALKPDLLIVAPRDFEAAKTGRGSESYPILVWSDGVSLKDSETRIAWLGQIFQQTAKADQVVKSNRDQMDTIAQKVAKIPVNKRPRVMRLMLTPGGLLTPGRDSFMTEMIAAAGAITPDFGSGLFVPVSLERWLEFKPDVIFDCGTDHADLVEFLKQDQWREVPAVQNNQMLNFPCELTCRAASNTGYFISWLAGSLHTKAFAETRDLVHSQEVLSERPIDLDIPYVARARIVDSRLLDFVHRTLLIDFKRPQTILSTSGGYQEWIETIGNSYSPTPTWGIYHQLGFERSKTDIFKVLNLVEPEAEGPSSADARLANLMFTGANLNNLVVKSATYKEMTVTALVTAGVGGNALRSSKDTGAWYEPGTINIIVLSNHRLSPSATARALITITEAKTAALWDMDIRSSQTPLPNPATGTGTDDIIVVSGEGTELTYSGGHTKLGQLMAEVVYQAVQEAILKQNGLAHSRTVFERLAERGLSLHGLIGGPDCPCQEGGDEFERELEGLLLKPRYQGFLQAAFSLSDAQEMGQLKDLGAFEDWARQIASEIAGRPVEKIELIIGRPSLPPVLQTALNALGTGLKYRGQEATTD